MAKTKTESVETTPEDLIAAAMAEATVASGAHVLPPAGEVPVALTNGNPALSDIVMPPDTALAAAQQAALAENPHCPAAVKLQAEQMAKALGVQAPPAPPAQIGIGPLQRLVPASVRTAPHQLHSTNNVQAQALWNAFVGERKKMLATLAAKAGFVRTPFVWLSQALWVLVDIDRFMPVKREGDPEFNPAQKDPAGTIFPAFALWAGVDLAHHVVLLCERANVDLIVGLGQMFDRLNQKKEDELRKAQVTETVEQWAQ